MLDSFLDYSFDPVYLIGPGMTVEYVNQAAEHLLGYSREEFMSMDLSQIDPLIRSERCTDLCRSPQKSAGQSNIFETLHRRKDGTLLPVEVSFNAFEHEGRQVVLAIARDISARKEFEEKLRKSESAYRSLAENSPDFIIRYDLEGRILYLNARLAVVLGVSQSEVIGQFAPDALTDYRFNELATAIPHVMKTGVAQMVEISAWFSGSGYRFHHIWVIPERDSDGSIRGVISFGRDVTAFKQAQQALENSQMQLRALVARRDEIREQERLHMARDIHDDLGQKLSTLRMQLATLQIQIGSDNPGLEESCLCAMSVADEAIQTVRSIATALRPVSLDMGIVSAIEWLAQDFEKRTGVACRLHVEEGFICPDDDQSIHKFRIVQECLSNVIRHAAASRVLIKLESDCEQVRLSVCDNGVGFDAQTHKPGVWGLIGIRERVLLLGGQLVIESGRGQGTTVSVTLPRPSHMGPQS